MKRIKILFPTLSCLAIVPAVVSLSSCNKTSVEEEILNAVLNPANLTESKELPKDTFSESYESLSDAEKKNELLYDTFGIFNQDFGDDTDHFNINDLYTKNHEGGFKVNVTNYSVEKSNDQYNASLLGYISYVFSAQHKAYINETDMIFNANDYIMITFDFRNIKVNLGDSTNYSISLKDTDGFSLGFYKYRYHGSNGVAEKLQSINNCDTSKWKVKNSKNWVK